MERRQKPMRIKKKKAFHDYMTPGFWRSHHVIPAFIALVGLGVALGIAHFSSFDPNKVSATTADNVYGWAWSDAIGWISMNDQPPICATAPSCGSYGARLASTVTVQPHPAGAQGHALTGYVWSDNLGFICFGTSCNIAACRGSFLPSPPGTGFYAYVDPITDQSVKKVHGWAVICNLKDEGWISLNCEDTGTCSDPTVAGDRNYKLVYNPVDKKFHNAGTPGSPFGWNGNNDGSGIGYVNFYPWAASPDGMHLVTPAENCSVTGDEDLNGLADCSDPACSAAPQCQEINAINGGATLADKYQACHDNLDNDGNAQADCTGFGVWPADASCVGSVVCNPEANCSDGVDNDGDSFIDCADSDCSAAPNCQPESICDDGVDNDGDGLTDCADSDCTSDPSCTPQPACNDNPVCNALSGQDKIDCCCNDNSTNGPHPLDCLDPLCIAQAPRVCSAWSSVVTGNIYAGGGVAGTQAPKAVGTNVKYCLRSTGVIEWTSEASCKEESAGAISLPVYPYYRNKLGFLDLAGIRSGRYGTVQPVVNSADIPVVLGGRVYRYTGGGTFVLSAKTFNNGVGATGRGNGLLFIDGGNLQIDANIAYTADPVQTSLRNLASFGIIVVKDAFGNGGNITVNHTVDSVSGTLFAEGFISTGTVKTSNPAASDVSLKFYGLLVAEQFNLLRNNDNPQVPAEEIIFDGRAVVNPPPGMQDISKSLPNPEAAF